MPQRSPFGPIIADAAPEGMRRRGEDRLVEDVFPVAGEFLLAHDDRRDRPRPAAGAADDDARPDLERARAAERKGRHVDPRQRLDETEAGGLVIAERVARNGPAVAQPEPDRFPPR